MYEEAIYKILISVYVMGYLYLISYGVIISDRNSYNVKILNGINIASIFLFLLGYKLFDTNSVYIQNKIYEVYFVLEQVLIGLFYLFTIKICKPYLKTDWRYTLYVFLFPIITTIGLMFGFIDLTYAQISYFSNYDLLTSLLYDKTLVYTSIFYFICLLAMSIKVILEKIKMSKSYKLYYISFLVLFTTVLIYEIVKASNLLSEIDIFFFLPTVVLIMNIITYRYVNEAKIVLSREHVFNKLSTSYVIVDNNSNIVDYNTTFKDNFLNDISKSEKNNLNNILNYFKYETLSDYENEYIFIKEYEDKTKYFTMTDTELISAQEVKVGKLVEFIDITDKISLIKQQDELLNTDELTGLYSRRFYYDAVENYSKEEYLPIAFLSCDINNLKVVNDTFGHKFGDKYIIHNARELEKIFPDTAIISRVGGDEIVALIPNCKDGDAREMIRQVEVKNEEIIVKPYNKVDISVGYAIMSSLNDNPEDILALADQRMYEHKAKNKKGRK